VVVVVTVLTVSPGLPPPVIAPAVVAGLAVAVLLEGLLVSLRANRERERETVPVR
jgi:hypothetical protein